MHSQASKPTRKSPNDAATTQLYKKPFEQHGIRRITTALRDYAKHADEH